MKKITTIALLLLIPFAENAQSVYKLTNGTSFSRELIDIPASILAIYLVSLFLLQIIKWIMESRIKSKIIDKGVSDEMAKQFLQPVQQDNKHRAMKSFIVLSGIGVGITLVNFFQPIGIHSIAILVFSIATSFLAYYFYISRSKK